jgi:hypothetical protein
VKYFSEVLVLKLFINVKKMSRIGKLPIVIPEKVEVTLEGSDIKVK